MIPDPLGSNLIKGACQYNIGMYMYIIHNMQGVNKPIVLYSREKKYNVRECSKKLYRKIKQLNQVSHCQKWRVREGLS